MSDTSNVLGDIAQGAVKGAALGTIVPGVGNIIGAVGGALLAAFTDLAPELGLAQVAGADPGKLLDAATAVTQAVTGKSNPTPDDIAGLPADQRAALRVQLAQVAAQQAQIQRDAEKAEQETALAGMQAQLADLQSSRSMFSAAASAKSWTAFVQPVLSFVILGLFAAVIMGFTPAITANHESLLQNVLIMVLQFWFSGARNAQIDAALANSVPSHVVIGMVQGGGQARPLSE